MSIWFHEQELDLLQYGFAIDGILYQGRSEFQTISVVQTKAYGKMLLLDEKVMLTEQDEYVYHEMIGHIPALVHSGPKEVVVIGGGDGGTVRELLRHKSIERIVLAEIDQLVIDISKEFFPKVAGKLSDSRVEVKVGDGLAYVKNLPPESLDLLLVDSTDPIGPGEGLFTGEFYRNAARSLKSDGIMAMQSESPWHPVEFLHRIANNVRQGFRYLRPYVGGVPTYPRGTWSWTLAANHEQVRNNPCSKRFAEFSDELQYLTPEMLTSVFALPKFYVDKIALNRG